MHKPSVHLHLDYAGPFLGKMFLIVIDAHSKWTEVFPMNTSTSSATIEKLRITFVTHGLPEIVVTENGSNFVSRDLKISSNKTESVTSEPHPITQHLTEWQRAVQTFKERMKKMNGGSVEKRNFKFSCSLQIHRSDFNRRVTGRTASRKETQIESRPSLPRNWKESATKSGLSETGT